MQLKLEEFFYSGVVWVPWNLLLYFLFFEHYARDMRNPQSQIILCIAMGATFRCIWFFLYSSYGNYIFMLVFNRVAILLQFTAVSILMLMWLRAVNISNLTDREIQHLQRMQGSKSAADCDRSESGSHHYAHSGRVGIVSKNGPAVAAGAAATSAAASGGDSDEADKKNEMRDPNFRANRVQSLQLANETVVQRCIHEKKFRNFHIVVVAANAIVWILILCSLADSNQYDVNSLLISLLCLAEALCTLVVGVRVGIALKQALAPVFVTYDSSADYQQSDQQRQLAQGHRWGQVRQWCRRGCGWWMEIVGLYSLIFCWDRQQQGLRMQREVLKVVLSVSSICALFFLLRSVGFMYRPIVVRCVSSALLCSLCFRWLLMRRGCYAAAGTEATRRTRTSSGTFSTRSSSTNCRSWCQRWLLRGAYHRHMVCCGEPRVRC